MLQKPRDALVFAALIMVPAFFIADRADESSLVAAPTVIEEEGTFTPPASEPVGEFDEDALDVDDWYEESGIEDQPEESEEPEEPEFVVEDTARPAAAPVQSTGRGFEADIRRAVAAMDAR
jgi:hypothetical protein